MADYFVDQDGGDDGNDGLSAGNAWATINQVNSSSFSAGDSISLQKADTWREQLTVPSSGDSDNQITFGVYGNGADPIINGADLVTGWTEQSGTSTWTAGAQTGVGPGDDTWGSAFNVRNIIENAHISSNGTQIRIQIRGHSTSSTSITHASIGERDGSTDDFASAPTEITFDGGSTSTTVGAGATKWSDWITFAVDETKDYLIHFYGNASTSTCQWPEAGSTNSYYLSSATDYTLTQSWNGTTAYAGIEIVQAIEVNYANIWQAALTSEPLLVWFNNTRGIKETAVANLNTDQEWFWASNILYQYSTSDPDTRYTDPGTEAGIRSENIDDNGKDYIIIDGINCTKTAGSDATLGGIKLTGSHNIVRNLTSYSHRRHALSFYTGANNNTATNCIFYHDGIGAPVTFYGVGTDDNLLSDCTVYGGESYNIIIHGEAERNIIERCDLYDVGQGQGQLICITESGTQDNIVRYNYGHGLAKGFILVQDCSDTQIYYNKIDASNFNTVASSSCILLNGSVNNEIYNNTIFGATEEWVFQQVNNATGTIIKNNICNNDYYIAVQDGSQTNSIYDNNCYYGGGANAFHWRGIYYTAFVDWKTNSGQDANSVNSDPLMTDPANGNFTLQSTSPCIGVGANVNLVRDYAGNQVHSGYVAIGAYENMARQTNPTMFFGTEL